MGDYVKYMSAEQNEAASDNNSNGPRTMTAAALMGSAPAAATGSAGYSGHSANVLTSSSGDSSYATESRSGMAPSSYQTGSSHQPGSSSSYASTSGGYAAEQHSTLETIASYIPGTQANAQSKVDAGSTYGSSGHHTSTAGTSSGHVQEQHSVLETVASYIPGTQANAHTTHHSEEAPKGSGEGYIGGVTGETIASYIPGTQANVESKAIAHDSLASSEAYHAAAPASSGILGTIASIIPGTEAYKETHDTSLSTSTSRNPIASGYSTTAPSSNEYNETSSRGQGFAEKYPGGDSYASGGGLATTVASYIPGTQAHADSTGYQSGTSQYGDNTGVSRSSDRYGEESLGSTIASYVPATQAHADSTNYQSSAPQYGGSSTSTYGERGVQDSYASGQYETGSSYPVTDPRYVSEATATGYLPEPTASTLPQYMGTGEIPVQLESHAMPSLAPVPPTQVASSHASITSAVSEDSKTSRMSIAQKARGGMTEFDRDEAIINSVLNEPIHKTGKVLNPAIDESTQKSHEAPGGKKAGKTPANPARDESTQKSNETHSTSKGINVTMDESTRGGDGSGRIYVTNPAQDESTQKSYEMRGGRSSGI